jgi:ABC-type multidrug transport system, ATPase and permease components
MRRMIDRLSRLGDRLYPVAEEAVDPFGPYDESQPPPERLVPFLLRHLAPLNRVLALAMVFGLLTAAVETTLIYYAGRIVDLLAGTDPADLLRDRGLELFAAALFVLLLRPAVQIVGTLLLNQAMLPNIGTLVRWRTHRHVLRQSMGFFQNDFAGRIANKIMQTAPAVGEATFQIFDALWFAVFYIIGAFVVLADTDWRLAVPLVIWTGAYLGCHKP